jgi:predicted RND superfamily exporter protein
VKSRLPVILAVLFGVLTLAFRTVRGVLLPLVTIGLAQLWTLALVGHLDRPLNAVTVMVPLLLVILGLVYSVHVISAYYDELRARPAGDPAVSMVRALARTPCPCCLPRSPPRSACLDAGHAGARDARVRLAVSQVSWSLTARQ